MKAALICLALFAGQMITSQRKPEVHLKPHSATIESGFGGSLLKLINGPPVVILPPSPPKYDASGAPWEIDVMNLGPAPVLVIDAAHSTVKVKVSVNQTVHIYWNGSVYSLKS
jgi:hypothetical protein